MEPGRAPAEPPPSRPFAIAITGGIGAGKSEALRAFSRHGAATLSSDEIVHDLIRDDAEVRAQLVDRFGEGILAADGTPERARIAEIVFADRDELRWLERLLHPRVVGCYLAWRDELARRPEPPAVCAIEVPLLYEAGGEGRFDAVVAITAPAAVRHARSAAARDERERRLLPDEEKVRRSDFAYANDGTLADLDAFVAEVLEQVRARA